MASPRTRRLKLDSDMLQQRFVRWPRIQIASSRGWPPESYNISYAFKGLYVDERGKILERNLHLLEINLSLEYPRRAPQCRMLTPVFHPNFDNASICIGDFWAASEWLDDLVIRIGRMITYQDYNIRSPLNGTAARWAAEHQNRLPIDSQNIAPPADGPSPVRVDDAPRIRMAGETFPKAVNAWPERIVIRTS